jgi:hypothetical protein
MSDLVEKMGNAYTKEANRQIRWAENGSELNLATEMDRRMRVVLAVVLRDLIGEQGPGTPSYWDLAVVDIKAYASENDIDLEGK